VVYETDGHGLVAAIKDLEFMNAYSIKTACDELILNGYSDWYLPSKDELNALYVNLKQRGVGGFASARYWCSSKSDNGGDWHQYFDVGYQYNFTKVNAPYYVRAVRAF
jgi:hypothetical protein